MKKVLFVSIWFLILAACGQKQQPSVSAADSTSTVQTDAAAQTIEPTKIEMDGELPSKGSIPALFDEMDYQQATQCYLWALPIVSFAEWQRIQFNDFGATNNDLVLYNSYDDRLGILTANA